MDASHRPTNGLSFAANEAFMPAYGQLNYWEQRYTREPAAFDWYQEYNGLKHLLLKLFAKESNLLQIGVGTSRLQEDMVRAGYTSIMNIDFSMAAIKHMTELHKDIPQLKYMVANARDLKDFKEASFDGVIDKGTVDTMMCGPEAGPYCEETAAAVSRVLKVRGSFLMMSYAAPHYRLPYLCNPDLNFTIEIYVMTKPGLAEPLSSTETDPMGAIVIKGPYASTNLNAMEALSVLTNVYFVYVCTKQKPPLVI